MLALLAGPCLLSACGAADRVVLKPIALPPVAPALVADMRPPRCALPPAPAYEPNHLGAETKCYAVAEKHARNKHAALAAAVRIREKAMDEIVAKSAEK